MTTSIKHQLFFPHPATAVWEYLTKPELMELWLMKSDFEPIIGHEFQFRARPMPNFNFDGIIYCKVLEIIPFKKLSYSWKGGPGEGKITLDSVVVWELQEKEGGTELFLDHTGFATVENFAMYDLMNDGWLKNIHEIADFLNAAQNGTTKA